MLPSSGARMQTVEEKKTERKQACQSLSVVFGVREMHLWAFCCRLSLGVIVMFYYTRRIPYGQLGTDKEGLGGVEKDLSQNPNCVKLSNKPLLSLQEKRIKNSCYIYSGPPKEDALFTDNRESFFFDRAKPTRAPSFLLCLHPPVFQN